MSHHVREAWQYHSSICTLSVDSVLAEAFCAGVQCHLCLYARSLHVISAADMDQTELQPLTCVGMKASRDFLLPCFSWTNANWINANLFTALSASHIYMYLQSYLEVLRSDTGTCIKQRSFSMRSWPCLACVQNMFSFFHVIFENMFSFSSVYWWMCSHF